MLTFCEDIAWWAFADDVWASAPLAGTFVVDDEVTRDRKNGWSGMKERRKVITENGFMGCVKTSVADSPANMRQSTSTRT